MNRISNKTIAIIGGGPGGLTLARLLQMSGAEVKVYERDRDRNARAQGATLDLHEDSGLMAIRETGLMDAFKANYRPGADKLRITGKDAQIITCENIHAGDEMFRPEIDRGPLQKILLDSLKPETVVWNSQFVSLSPQGDSLKLIFKNGSSVVAGIVIGADGANSGIRPYITPVKPFFAGITVVEGTVYQSETASPRIHDLLNGGKIFALGDEKSLIVSSKGDGSLVFYTGCKTNEQWFCESGIDFSDRAQVLGWFKTEFAGWSDIWHELFEHADSRFVPRPQYCMPLEQQWEALSNLTMLGDAAHLMPPYAGEGVNMAMLDALELSRCLSDENFPDLQTAIAAFEYKMRIRTAEIAKITLEATAALHSDDAISWLINIVG